MKICPVGSKLFHADRQTNMTGLIVALRNFANTPKKGCLKCKLKKGLQVFHTDCEQRLRKILP